MEMRAWVGCLGCYNAGRLIGDWHDAVDAADVTIEDLHGGKPCPEGGDELHCFDTEGIGHGECSPAEATRRAKILAEADDPEALLVYWQHVGGDLETAARDFPDAYCGAGRGEDYAEGLADELGLNTCTWPASCIDWEHAWHELTYDGYFEAEGYIFRSV